MRVLAVMASGAVGGGANHLRLLLPALTRMGVEIQAAVGSNGPLAMQLGAAGIATETVNLMRSRVDPRAPLALAALLRRSGADLVHYHGTRAAFFGSLARRFAPPIPAVYTVHGLAYSKRVRGLRKLLPLLAERIACAGTAQVVSVSAPDLDDLIQHGFVALSRATAIENPVDPQHFMVGSRAATRALLGLASDDPALVTVARLVPQKAVDVLIDAVGRCQRPLQLVIIGDGPLRAQLEAQAAASKAPVMFIGERDDVARLWPAFDAFVLSSRWEGEPMAMLEAMAAGLPCVATATRGSALALGDEGHLVPVDDPGALAAALDDIVALDPTVRSALGLRLRLRVHQRNPEKIAARLLTVYRRALNSSSC